MRRWDFFVPLGLFAVSAAASFMRVAYAAEAMLVALLLMLLLPLLRRTHRRGSYEGVSGEGDGHLPRPPSFTDAPRSPALAGTAHHSQALDAGVGTDVDGGMSDGLDAGVDFGGGDFGGGD